MTPDEFEKWAAEAGRQEADALAATLAEQQRLRHLEESSAPPRVYNSASILHASYCRACGWPIVFVCCNDGMGTEPPYKGWDWWVYCSNKTCENHAGEGKFQSMPEFIRIFER